MLKLNRSVNFAPGPTDEAWCVPSQIQSPTNHLSNDSCSGSFCASAALAGLVGQSGHSEKRESKNEHFLHTIYASPKEMGHEHW